MLNSYFFCNYLYAVREVNSRLCLEGENRASPP